MASKERNYHDQVNIDNAVKLRELLATLPSFCKDYFRGIETSTSSRTRLAYAYDIRVFFEFMHQANPVLSKMEIAQYPITILDEIKPIDIEEYLEYLTYYKKDGKEITNDERGKARKLACLVPLLSLTVIV
jgi:hypothetical protein